MAGADEDGPQDVLHVACPKCGTTHVLCRPAQSPGRPMWAVECGCRHRFGVFVDVTAWPTRRVQDPIPLRLAAGGD